MFAVDLFSVFIILEHLGPSCNKIVGLYSIQDGFFNPTEL